MFSNRAVEDRATRWTVVKSKVSAFQSLSRFLSNATWCRRITPVCRVLIFSLRSYSCLDLEDSYAIMQNEKPAHYLLQYPLWRSDVRPAHFWHTNLRLSVDEYVVIIRTHFIEK